MTTRTTNRTTTEPALPADEPTVRFAAADSRTAPVTLLRAAAALLGVYGFLVTLWLAGHGSHPQPIPLIREWLNRPLGLGEDFGPLAIMLLLLCTGYTAAATGFRATRLVLVCLPALVAAACAAVVLLAGLDVWTIPDGTPLVPLAWVSGLQLVAWLVTLDQRVWPTTLALLAAVGALCVFASDLPQLGRPALFLPLVLVGRLTWHAHDRTLPTWAVLLLGTACFAAVFGVDRTFPGLARWWYPIAACHAVLLFLVAVRGSGPNAARLAAHPVTRWFADRAEWLLLLGGVIGFAVLGPLRGVIPVPLGLLVALATVALATEVCHRLTKAVLA